MAELLKEKYYNDHFIHELALRLKEVYPSFETDHFANDIVGAEWEESGLKKRMRKITLNLGKYLPPDYEQALCVIDMVAAGYPAGFHDNALIIFPDFVEVYGQDECYWDLSVPALAKYTQISTAEFAVRPFIIKYEKRMLDQMMAWTEHGNEHVRRLASEGCRPRLPWGQALPNFQKDPRPVLDILEKLKTDPSLYVRKSVANNLNDISKTHPDLVVEIAKAWYGRNAYTDQIVKHGCRTLLKKGNRAVMDILGYYGSDSIKIEDFSLETVSVRIGEALTFSFVLSAEEDSSVRVEYAVDYVKANGTYSRKIYKIAEKFFNAGEKKEYIKSHSFADFSTRKHYCGIHSIALMINGTEWGRLDFELRKQI